MQFITQHNANLVHGVSIVGTKGVQGKKQALLRAANLREDRARDMADRSDPSTELPTPRLEGANPESGLGKQSCPGYSRSLSEFAASRLATLQTGWQQAAGRTAVADRQVEAGVVNADPANAQATFPGAAATTSHSAHADGGCGAVGGASMPQTARSTASQMPAASPVEASLSERPQAEPARTIDMVKVTSPAPIWATFVLSRALSS